MTVLLFLAGCLPGVLLLTYPLLTWLRTLRIKKTVSRSHNFIRPVSIIIAAYNEERFLRDKLAFFLQEKEWIPGSELIVISAGSVDGTNSIISEFAKLPDVIPIVVEKHLPKTLALNVAVARSSKDILVFSDCRQDIETGSVRNLVSYFNDPDIGAVNSTLVDEMNSKGLSFFRKVLNFICFNDSNCGSSLSIHGALYAQRRVCFRKFPPDILHDDLFAVVSTIAQGKRLVQARDVLLRDISFTSYYTKGRIERLARGLMLFLLGYWRLIFQMPTSVALRFLLFKYLKLFLPALSFLSVFLIVRYWSVIPPSFLIAVAVVVGAGLLHRGCRRSLLFVLRINLFFATALFKFFFLNKRECYWEKEKTLMVPVPKRG